MSAEFDGLKVINNTIDSIGSAPANWSGSPSLSVRGAGIVLHGQSSPSGTVEHVDITGNNISILSGASFFQRGVWLTALNANITGNTIAGAANDVIFQFASGGSSLIDDNDFVGQHRGGGAGLVIADPNSGSPITVSNNLFDAVPGDPAVFPVGLQVNHNASNSAINIAGNTFVDHAIGVDLGSAVGVTVQGNTFTPAANLVNTPAIDGDYVHIRVDSQNASNTGNNTLLIDTKIYDNTFNSAVGSTGTAVRIENDLSGGQFSGLQIGGTPTQQNDYSGLTAADVGVRVAGGKATITETINNLTGPIVVSGGQAIVSGTTLTGLSQTGTGIAVSGTGAASVLNSSVKNYATGVSVNQGKALLEGNDLRNNKVGIYVVGDAVVDAGQKQSPAPVNYTGFVSGTGTGINGSSIGGNQLTGYTGVAGNYAIDNDNLDSPNNVNVYAELNNYGSNVLATIDVVVDHTTDNAAQTQVFFSQFPVLTVGTPVYVDADWAGTALGADPDGAPGLGYLGIATNFGVDAFATIQDAIDAVGSGAEIIVFFDTYDQNVVINKTVSLKAVADPDTAEPAATVTRTAGTNTALFTVAASDVTIDGFDFLVDQAHATAGVNMQVTTTAHTNLTVKNSIFRIVGTAVPGGATSYVGFGTDSTAIAVRSDGTSTPTVHILDNQIVPTLDVANNVTAIFDRAIFLRVANGEIRGNTIWGDSHDLAAQFVGGTLTVDDNDFMGKGGKDTKGAQVDFTEPGSTGVIEVTNNRFTPYLGTVPSGSSHVRSLMIKNNDSSNSVTVSGNQFTVSEVGILLGNSKSTTITGNTFTPVAGDSSFTGIQVSNKVPTVEHRCLCR